MLTICTKISMDLLMFLDSCSEYDIGNTPEGEIETALLYMAVFSAFLITKDCIKLLEVL